MATKKTTTKKTHRTYTETTVVRFMAFWSMAISALVWLVGGILSFCGLGQVAGIMTMIATIFTLIALAIPAWRYVRNRMKYKNVYLAFFIIIVIAILFGGISAVV